MMKHHDEFEEELALLTIEVSSMITFLAAVMLFAVNSSCDLKTRKIPNRLILAEGVISLVIVFWSGKILSQPILHLLSMFIALTLGYVLFRTGSLGGGDVKTLLVISLISPGLAFNTTLPITIEAHLGVDIPLIVALLLGHLYIRYYTKRVEEKTKLPPPLVPYLFGGYILVQLFGLLLSV